MHERAFYSELNGNSYIQDWLKKSRLTAEQNDCVTAIVLKVLDAKCKMDAVKQSTIMSVYAQTRSHPGLLFHQDVHQAIDRVIHSADEAGFRQIHVYRQFAEASIPRPVMKTFKAFLRESLFAEID